MSKHQKSQCEKNLPLITQFCESSLFGLVRLALCFIISSTDQQKKLFFLKNVV